MLSVQPDYFECSICMEIPAQLDVLECPVCCCHTCKTCLIDFTLKKRGKDRKDSELYTCTICLKDYKMRLPNKLMLMLLKNVILFGCSKCARYWKYDEYQSHDLNGKCKKDEKAANNISSLAAI